MMHAPAPVADIRAIVPPTAKRRTGLLPMRVGSTHIITIAHGTPQEASLYAVARGSADAEVCATHLVCLHPDCRGKKWPTLTLMHEGHPGSDAMTRADAAHVYGLWSDDPVDATKIEPLKVAKEKAEKRAAAAKDAAEKDGGLNDVAEARATKAEEIRAKAVAAYAAASAPIGLIAPPELRAVDM